MFAWGRNKIFKFFVAKARLEAPSDRTAPTSFFFGRAVLALRLRRSRRQPKKNFVGKVRRRLGCLALMYLACPGGLVQSLKRLGERQFIRHVHKVCVNSGVLVKFASSGWECEEV